MYATASSSRLRIKRLVLSALMLALAYVLPFFTGNIPQIGSMLLPMHLPVLLCGFLCGGPWGALVGFIAPLMRSGAFTNAIPGIILQLVALPAIVRALEKANLIPQE